MKKTQQEKLQARQINPPNGLLYSGLMQIVKLLNRQIHTTFHFKADPRQDSGPMSLSAIMPAAWTISSPVRPAIPGS